MEETKVCTRCQEEVPLEQFHKNSSTRDGLHTICKPCRCMYSALTTDHEAKRASQRRNYQAKKASIRSARVALKMLQRLEWQLGINPTADFRSSRDPKSVLREFVPEAAVERIRQLLESHVGFDRYLSGFNTRWAVRFARVPMLTTEAAGDLKGFVRGVMRPDNIEFVQHMDVAAWRG